MISIGKIWQSFLINKFHQVYYNGPSGREKIFKETSWNGFPVYKCPFDLWKYQEIIFDTKPDVIIETGTNLGGSALFFADLFDLIGNGEVFTIDIQHPDGLPVHERISYITGSSTDEGIVGDLRVACKGKRVMVVLDSDHSRDHVLNELKMLSGLVTEGCYLIVEDTNVNGHPVAKSHGPGPHEALQEFLVTDNCCFVVDDSSSEKYLVSFNPGGYLVKQPS